MHRKIMLAITILVLSTAASAAQPGADQKTQMVWGGGADRTVGTFQSEGSGQALRDFRSVHAGTQHDFLQRP